MNSEEAKDRIEKLLTELTEHFPESHIQVLMTFNSEGRTKSISTGVGNWYARQGLAHEFINFDIAQENARQISEAIKPPPESGEQWEEK